jgi:hypothetical protein
MVLGGAPAMGTRRAYYKLFTTSALHLRAPTRTRRVDALLALGKPLPTDSFVRLDRLRGFGGWEPLAQRKKLRDVQLAVRSFNLSIVYQYLTPGSQVEA